MNDIDDFLQTVMGYYQQYGRHDLPWRKKKHVNPYSIAVSEVMLQQTQVVRVVDYFQKWMIQFPDVGVLAAASNEEVLSAWQGLGYNNRGLRLKKLAQVVLEQYGGKFPQDRKSLESLPGIGPYTAGAIRAFVWNEPDVFIETNIRRVLLHHFFEGRENVADNEVSEILQSIVSGCFSNPGSRIASKKHNRATHSLFFGSGMTPREFYWALMDYGATLPKALKSNPNKQSKHYTKQSRFEGSVRQVRSGIVKWLLEHKVVNVDGIANILGIVNPKDERIEKALKGLERDGLIEVKSKKVVLKK